MPTLYDLLATHEGAGNPDTLFGHAQTGGGKFGGTKVSKMNLGQLKEFTNPQGDYGQWVKNELRRSGHRPRVSTPLGVGQIVGSTLRDTQKALGLADDVLFDETTQRAMINHLAKKRINPDDKAATLTGLRQEWEGFKSVSDDDLWQAALSFDGSDPVDPSKLNTGKGHLFQFQKDMQDGSSTTRDILSKYATMQPGQLDMGQSEVGPPPPGQLMTQQNAQSPAPLSAPPNEVVAQSYTPNPSQYQTGVAAGGAPGGASPEEERKQTLLDKIGGALFPNAEDPTGQFKQTLGALGVGLGQMSHGQPVDLQPYFNNIAARKQAAAKSLQDAEQQRVNDMIRVGTLENQQRQTDISAARLAHDVSKTGGAPRDYAAIVSAHPELANSGIVELAQSGDKNAQQELVSYAVDKVAASSAVSDAQRSALNTYLGADGPKEKAAALDGLGVEDAQKVVDLAADLSGDDAAPAAWQTAVNLHNDNPVKYPTAGAAFEAIKKMEATGGGIHPKLIESNIKTGTELQLALNERATEGQRIMNAAVKAERAVKEIITSGSKQGASTKSVGSLLGNIPFVGSEAKAKFYDAIGYEALATQELTQVQGDMLALIAKDYAGQGEISDGERAEMAKRVISGDMDEVTMMAEIQRMKADGAFKEGDARLFRSVSNSANLHSKHAEAQERIRDFGNMKRMVLDRQRLAGEYRFFLAEGTPNSDDKAIFDERYRDKNGTLNKQKYFEDIAPPVSDEFVKYYANSLPIIAGKNGEPYHIYMNEDGELQTIKVK